MQKFIVTNEGRLRFGDVNLHRHLLKAGEDCIGGGVYEFDYINGRMLLSGKSYDYGRVKWACVDTLIVPESLRGLEIMYEDLPVDHYAAVRYE